MTRELPTGSLVWTPFLQVPSFSVKPLTIGSSVLARSVPLQGNHVILGFVGKHRGVRNRIVRYQKGHKECNVYSGRPKNRICLFCHNMPLNLAKTNLRVFLNNRNSYGGYCNRQRHL